MQEEKEKEIHLHKPNSTITINNNNMTLRQRKSYNILLYKAKQELNKNSFLELFAIPIDELIETSGNKNKNIKTLEADLKKLMDIKIETIKDSTKWNSINLLGEVWRDENIISFGFAPTIRKALAGDEKLIYTTLDLIILKSLTSKYSVILYEIALRYEKVEIPAYTIQEFKKLMGAENPSYNQYGVLKQKVIDVAVQEINQKTDIKISYTEIKKSGIKKVESLKFNIDEKRNYSPKKYKKTKVKQKTFNDFLNEKDTINSNDNIFFDEEKHQRGLEEMEKVKKELKKKGVIKKSKI